jgi:hypothetical protein
MPGEIITVGSVGVEVFPDGRQWASRLRAQLLPDASRVGQEFGRALGDAAQRRIADGIAKGVKDGGSSAGTDGARAGEEYGGRYATALKARLEAALRSLPDVKIDADSTDAERAIAGIRGALQELRDARIGVDLSTDEAETKLQVLAARLEDLKRDAPNIQVRTDALAASAELEKFHAQVRELNGLNPTIRPDVDTGAAQARLAMLRAQADNAGGGMSNLALAALALGPALAPIGAVGVGAMAAIAVGATAAAGAVGVLVIALAPIIEAVQASTAAQAQAGAAAGSAASKALQLASAQDALKQAQRGVTSAIEDAREAEIRSAEAIKQAQQSVVDAKQRAAEDQRDSARRIADAQQGLVDAEERSDRERIDSARRVGAAKRNLADVQRRAAQDQVQASRAVQQAEQQLAAAQRSVLDAQQRLNDAREQAARDMEDLQSRVANGALSEREATIRLTEARLRYQEVLADPTATDLERQKAQLAVDEAIQGLADQQRENQRLTVEQARSSAAGVDGSKAVKSAQQELIDAQQRVVEAQQRVADATAAAAEQQRKSAREIADAEQAVSESQAEQSRRQVENTRAIIKAQQALVDAQHQASQKQQDDAEAVARAQQRVADAVRNSADQQRRSAESIANAQQGVISAQRGIQQASMSAGSAGGAAMATLQDKLAKLSPAGREFVGFITDELMPAFRTISQAAQTGLLPGLEGGLKALLPVMPQIAGFVQILGSALGQLATEAGKALTGPFWTQFFTFLGQIAGPVLLTMGRTLGNVAVGFAGLMQAFGPLALQFGQALLGLSQRFADFGAGASKNKAFQDFLAYIRENGPRVAALFGALASAAGNIIVALAPIGSIVLDLVTGLARFVAVIPPPVLAAIVGGILAAVAAFKVLSVVMAILNVVLEANPVVLIIGAIIVAIAALVFAFISAYNNVEGFRKIVDTVWAAVKDATAAAWAFLQPILASIWDYITNTLVPAFLGFWHSVIEPAWAGIRTAVAVAWEIIRVIFAAVVSFVRDVLVPAFKTYLLPEIQLVWNLVKVAIELAWSVLQVIFKAIVLFVREVLGPIFRWLYDNVIKPVWDTISSAISTAWNNVIKPVLQTLGDFISNTVAPAFRAGVEAIGKAWSKVMDIAKAPVRFIIQTVINEGIIDTWNKIAGWFGVDPVEHVKLPDGFASGGLLRGRGTGTSDDILARVSNGEYVVRAAAVDALGVNFLDVINQADRLDLAGDPSRLVIRGAFAEGGAVQATKAWLPSADPLPYVWGGVGPEGYDCSGLAGEVWARLTNHPSFNRYFTTHSDFGSLGFKPGTGIFTIGVNAEHMAGNLAGLGFEAASTKSGIHIGPTAQSPQAFDRQYYLDGFGGSSQGAPGGISVLDPIGSLRTLLNSVLAPLSHIGGGPFGEMIGNLPRKAVDWAVNWVSDIFSFASGGLVGRDGALKPTLYDSGGYLPPGLTTVLNASGRPEPVLTGTQWDELVKGRGEHRPTFGDVYLTAHNPAPETASESASRMMRRLGAQGPK